MYRCCAYFAIDTIFPLLHAICQSLTKNQPRAFAQSKTTYRRYCCAVNSLISIDDRLFNITAGRRGAARRRFWCIGSNHDILIFAPPSTCWLILSVSRLVRIGTCMKAIAANDHYSHTKKPKYILADMKTIWKSLFRHKMVATYYSIATNLTQLIRNNVYNNICTLRGNEVTLISSSDWH